MSFQVLTSIALGFSAVCYFLLGVHLISGKREVGSLPMGITFVIVGLWVLGGAVELVAWDLSIFNIGRLGHFLGTAAAPVTILLCFREFVGRVTSKQAAIALSIIPVLSIIVAATNPWHGYMWSVAAESAAGIFLSRPEQFGPWFWFVHAPYGYAIIGTSIVTLIMRSSAVAPAQRRGLFMMAGATVVPIIGIIAYDLGIGPTTVPTLPIILSLMLPIYAWLVVAEKIVQFTPLAYETVFQNMQDPVIVVDTDERIIGLNHGAEALLDLNEVDALQESLDAVFGDDAREVHTALDTGEPQKMLTRSGRFLHVQVTPISTNNVAARNASVLMFRDVSDVENAQREVRNSEKLLRTLIDHSVNGIIRLRWTGDHDLAGARDLCCIFANAAAARYLDAANKDLIGAPAKRLVELATRGMDEEESSSLAEQFMNAAGQGEVFDHETRVGEGEEGIWLRVIGEPVGEDVAMTFVDITDRKQKEEQMESIARSDPLTGVLNRRGFERDAAERLSHSPDDAKGALLFIDLNDFKLINDRYGHDIGDELLRVSAKRLQKSLRSCDIIGRPGGDEFVALVPDVDAEVAEQLATRLTETLEQPYVIDNRELLCAASIGLALYPDHANTLTGLLRAADAAMYRAKARCRAVSSLDSTSLLEKAI